MTTALWDNSGENNQPVGALYVYLSVDKDGNEGLVGGIGLHGEAFSLAFGYEHVARGFLPTVRVMAEKSGTKIQLVRFTHRELLETLG